MKRADSLFFNKKSTILLICLILVCVTIFAYRNLANHEFINLDDDIYITNKYIRQGFTVESLIWVFLPSSSESRIYWHPLTWLSHTLDYHLFGLSAGKHLMVNLGMHVVSSILLFLIFYHMTGGLWKSAFVAALFALHPLNVESVAWVAERKNVLSTLFWMLVLVAYVYYTKEPGVLRYSLVFFVFLLGLLAKPMLVTLPVILLLLDFWPLGRCATRSDILRLGIEKIPLLILSLIIFILVSMSLDANMMVITTKWIPLNLRVANVLTSGLKYVMKVIWPIDLSVYYPFPESIPLWHVICAGILLCAITVLSLITIRRAPWLFFGWSWFIITLSPVSGIIQHGLWPELADRHAYVPAIGLFVMASWGWDDISKQLAFRRIISILLAVFILLGFTCFTRKQASYWQNTKTLFEHALAENPENPLAHLNLGAVMVNQGMIDLAIEHYYKALAIYPNYGIVHTNLGNAFYFKGIYEKAIYHYNIAANLSPGDSKSQSDLAKALAATERFDDALKYYIKALALEPENPRLLFNIGVCHYKLHNYSEAKKYFKATLEIKPDYEGAQNALNMLKGYN
jgi:protein O-mannosyl-transferase